MQLNLKVAARDCYDATDELDIPADAAEPYQDPSWQSPPVYHPRQIDLPDERRFNNQVGKTHRHTPQKVRVNPSQKFPQAPDGVKAPGLRVVPDINIFRGPRE